MSAGNVVLSSNAYNITVFPTTTTVLSSGNYWIEEIDFTLAYAVTSGVTTGTALLYQLEYGASVFWYLYFLIPPTSGAVVQPMNLIVTSRPRIFIPRGQTISLITSGGSASITSVVNSLNIYGRLLP